MPQEALNRILNTQHTLARRVSSGKEALTVHAEYAVTCCLEGGKNTKQTVHDEANIPSTKFVASLAAQEYCILENKFIKTRSVFTSSLNLGNVSL